MNGWTFVALINAIAAVTSAAGADDLLGMVNSFQQMLNPEENVLQMVQSFLDAQDLRLDKMKAYIEAFQDFQGLQGDTADFMGNPINAYLLVKRLIVDWKELEKTITQSQTEATQIGKLASLMTGSSDAPVSEEELNDAALAIIRLQDVYNLSISDIARGQLGHLRTNVVLSAGDCWRLGQQSLFGLDLDLALAWFEQGLLQANDGNNSTEQFNSQIDNVRLLKSLLQSSLKFMTPEVMRSLSSIPGLPTELLHHLAAGKDEDSSPQHAVYKTYKQLCRGETLAPVETHTQLDCMYIPHDFTGDLQRIKVEYLSFQPLVAMLHDVISDDEIQLIKETASSQLKPTKVHKYEDPSDVRMSPVRTAKAMWLPKKSHRLIRRLYQRVEDFTGLATSNAEDLHVVKYGLGGHYEVHTDFFDFHAKQVESEHGDRIATMLLYLSDVPAGGATVFPHLLLSVKPQKGSAVFWFNLHRNGKGDFRTIHAACPVLAGSKWVANMWIMDRDQSFRRPCSLNPQE